MAISTSKRDWNPEDTLAKPNHSGFCFILSQCMSHLGLNINIFSLFVSFADQPCCLYISEGIAFCTKKSFYPGMSFCILVLIKSKLFILLPFFLSFFFVVGFH